MFKQLGARIQSLRGRVSRSDFANDFGISQSSLVRWEKGERQPDLEFLSKVATAYGVSVDWLLYGDSVSTGTGGKPSDRRTKNYDLKSQLPENTISDITKLSDVGQNSSDAATLLRAEVEQLNQEIARLFTDKREMGKDLREALLEIDDKSALIDQLQEKIKELAKENERLKKG